MFQYITAQRYQQLVWRCILLWMLVIAPALTHAATENNPAPPACVEQYNPELDYFPQAATITHAHGFKIEYFKHYKLITVSKPWPDAKQSFRYLLVQCGTPPPQDFPNVPVINIPVRSIAALSTTHLAHLEKLGALSQLVAVSKHAEVYSPAAQALIAQGKIAEVGRGIGVNIERIIDLQPDLVTVVGHDQPQYNAHPLLAQAGINVVINAEYVEPSLLGRAEWLKFTAAFLNLDGLAQQQFTAMAERYREYAALVRDIPQQDKPTVLYGGLDRDVWHMPGGNSYTAHLIADAGGAYIWADNQQQFSFPLSFEAVFDRASAAQVWLINDPTKFERSALLAANERYGMFAAWRKGRVYNANGRLGQNRANAYWETAVLEPQIVLADMIKILHPQLLPQHQLQYYRWLP